MAWKWKRATPDLKVVGQILWSGQLEMPNPRFHGQIYGITGVEEEPTDEFLEWAIKVRKEHGLDTVE
jgi:hypothetical protein